jgi:endogenous inhibitor of DNA gyrase (YacG/DUF329 family)
MTEPLIVACPKCRKRGPWLEGPDKPFCSERCRLLDLGNWFEAEYKISEPLRPEHFMEFEELSEEVDPDKPVE